MTLNRKIIAMGAGVASVCTLAYGTVGSASAATPVSIVAAACQGLPASVTSATTELTAANAAVKAAAADLGAPATSGSKQFALGVAMSDLASTAVAFINAVDKGGDVNLTGAALNRANAAFADKLVSENNAMTTLFEAQRRQYLAGVSGNFVNNINLGLCGVALP